jgi:hypothetical protein
MHALNVCLKQTFALNVCLIYISVMCMPHIHALCLCLIYMPYVYAVYTQVLCTLSNVKPRVKDYYAILGVDPEDDQKAIKRVFRKLSIELHPDKVTTQHLSLPPPSPPCVPYLECRVTSLLSSGFRPACALFWLIACSHVHAPLCPPPAMPAILT